MISLMIVTMLQVLSKVLRESNKSCYSIQTLVLLVASGVVDDDTVKTEIQIFFFFPRCSSLSDASLKPKVRNSSSSATPVAWIGPKRIRSPSVSIPDYAHKANMSRAPKDDWSLQSN